MELLHTRWAECSAWFLPRLANHVWEATLFVALLLLVLLILPRSAPWVHYAFSIAGLIRFAIPSGLISWANRSVAVGSDSSLGLELPLPPVVFSLAQPAPLSESAALPSHSEAYCLLALFWVLGAGTVLTLWLRRYQAARVPAGAGATVTEGRTFALFGKVSRRLGIGRKVRLVSFFRGNQPVAVSGIFSPVLCLPHHLSETLSEEELEAVLTHELLHVRRRDNLVDAFQMLICAALWFHPLVWWMHSRARFMRECVRDQQVVAMTGDAETYAMAILKLCRRELADPVAGICGAGSAFKSRMREILSARRQPGAGPWRRPAVNAALAALVTAAVLLGGLLAEGTLSQAVGSPAQGDPDAALAESPGASAEALELAQRVLDWQPAIPPDLDSAYQTWFQEVVLIMTGSEKAAFLELRSDSERDEFVRQFWLRRDPLPATPVNEFKEEHYRRLRYADNFFGPEGWTTPRGRFYILFGPPARIESHPSENYERWVYRGRLSDGGGVLGAGGVLGLDDGGVLDGVVIEFYFNRDSSR
jgi:GWxTD domain-containing protein